MSNNKKHNVDILINPDNSIKKDCCLSFTISFTNIFSCQSFIDKLDEKFLEDFKNNNLTNSMVARLSYKKKDNVIDFTNVNDAVSYINNNIFYDNIKNNLQIENSDEFDVIINNVINNKDFIDNIKDALRIISFYNVNDLDNETYQILIKAIQLSALKFNINILDEI